MIVQIFGRPLSSCPVPSASQKNEIEALRLQVETLSGQIAQVRAELEAEERKYGEEYKRRVEGYNNTVRFINELASELEKMIEGYNAQVRAFNTCIGAE